jgi:hypothetical protein
MPIDVLGHRVNDNVRAMVQRILNVRAKERIIHHYHDAMHVCDGCYSPDIDQSQGGV